MYQDGYEEKKDEVEMRTGWDCLTRRWMRNRRKQGKWWCPSF